MDLIQFNSIELLKELLNRRYLTEISDDIYEAIDWNLIKEVANKKVSELHSIRELRAYQTLHGFKPEWVKYVALKKGLIRR